MKRFIAPNIVLLAVPLSFFCIFCLFREKFVSIFKNRKFPIIPISILTLIIQIFVYYNIFFMTDWDVMMAIDTAELYVKGIMDAENMAWPNMYFSMYPTNQFILVVMIGIFKVFSTFGVKTVEGWVFSAVIIQCILSCLVGYLIFVIIKDETESECSAIGGWILFFILIAMSGWEVIPYGDSLSLIYPILLIRIYQKMQHSDKWYFYWILLVTVTYWGYHIKATGFLVFISIVITEMVYFITKRKIDKTKLLKSLALAVCLIFVFNGLHSKMMGSTGLTINPELNSEMSLNLAISLNRDTDGMFSAEDVSMAMGIPTKAERDSTCLALAKQRLLSFNPITMIKHLTRKILVVYNDGTYAWGVGGVFYYKTYPDKSSVSTLLKNIFYTTGKYYDYFAAIKQMFWLFTLLMSLFVVLNKSKITLSVTMPLIAITLFELVFEALGRRIYIFVPIFIVACAIGTKRLVDKIGESK